MKTRSVCLPCRKDNDTPIITLKKDTATSTLLPIKFDFCKVYLTNHVCRYPKGRRKIEGSNDLICGLATCIKCINIEDEERNRCSFHKEGNIQKSPDENVTNESNVDVSSKRKTFSQTYKEMSEKEILTFVPNYVESYLFTTSIPGFNVDEFTYPGFCLLALRSEHIIDQMGTSVVAIVK